MREKYERTELDIIEFVAEDVIMASDQEWVPDEYEDDIVK